jgi:molybdate transport system ATP-binding protein
MKLLLEYIRVPLAEFTLEVSAEFHGRVTGIVGPSGAGKTTLLDVIAGLARPREGRVVLDDVLLTDTRARLHVPARARRMGYVSQDLALFPHLSVRRNLLYGHKGEMESLPLFQFDHVVEVLEIGALIGRAVSQLSGGERQRVGLARALLSSPRLLLLDEPLSSLDRALKAQIISYLKRVRDEFQMPMLLVSHSVEEIDQLCDAAIALHRGQVAPRDANASA